MVIIITIIVIFIVIIDIIAIITFSIIIGGRVLFIAAIGCSLVQLATIEGVEHCFDRQLVQFICLNWNRIHFPQLLKVVESQQEDYYESYQARQKEDQEQFTIEDTAYFHLLQLQIIIVGTVIAADSQPLLFTTVIEAFTTIIRFVQLSVERDWLRAADAVVGDRYLIVNLKGTTTAAAILSVAIVVVLLLMMP